MKDRTCAELVELVKAKGPEALDGLGLDGLGAVLDIEGAAAFIGITPYAVSRYHGRARRKRAAMQSMTAAQRRAQGDRWLWWPEPDLTLGGHPGWTKRTLVLARASMPGRGAGAAPTRRHYTEDERANAVRFYDESGRSLGDVAAELGINPSTLEGWVYASSAKS